MLRPAALYMAYRIFPLNLSAHCGDSQFIEENHPQAFAATTAKAGLKRAILRRSVLKLTGQYSKRADASYSRRAGHGLRTVTTDCLLQAAGTKSPPLMLQQRVDIRHVWRMRFPSTDNPESYSHFGLGGSIWSTRLMGRRNSLRHLWH